MMSAGSEIPSTAGNPTEGGKLDSLSFVEDLDKH